MFAERLAEAAGAARTCLAGAIHGEDALAQAMRHAVQGGKGLRAFLVIESARLHGVTGAPATHAAAAIEAIHAYSLVHDDMPCMDDDALRRGLPTVHVKWDEATAVLAGDALQSLAFELLSAPGVLAPAVSVEMVHSLAVAAGGQGMVLGQAQDIAAESAGRPLGLDAITTLQANKTGALIAWSCAAGPRLAAQVPAAMLAYAGALGLAFQIADDILDVEGDAAKTGKAVGKDEGRGKATFVSLLGLDGAKRRAADLVQQACDALDSYGEDADGLKQAARFVISRET